MWLFDRATTRRFVRCSAMRTRVLRLRRARASFLFIVRFSDSRLLLLRFLERYLLVGVTHPLALVRLRRTIGADLRRDLSDLLFVRALDHDLGLLRRLDLHALRHLVHDRMRKAERQVESVARGLGTIADADQREALI